MTSASGTDPDAGDDGGGPAAAVTVGWIMVGVLLILSVLEVYERLALDNLYPDISQFYFLRALFPSSSYYDVADWQNVVVFEIVPFLLFFYMSARMHLDPLRRILPTIIAMAVTGAALYAVQSFLNAFAPNISSLLVTGSPHLPGSLQSESPGDVLGGFLTPAGASGFFQEAVEFAAIGIAGISFGYFSGATPYRAFRIWLASGPRPEGSEVSEETVPAVAIRSPGLPRAVPPPDETED